MSGSNTPPGFIRTKFIRAPKLLPVYPDEISSGRHFIRTKFHPDSCSGPCSPHGMEFKPVHQARAFEMRIRHKGRTNRPDDVVLPACLPPPVVKKFDPRICAPFVSPGATATVGMRSCSLMSSRISMLSCPSIQAPHVHRYRLSTYRLPTTQCPRLPTTVLRPG